MSELLKQVALDGCGIAAAAGVRHPTRNSQRAARCTESGRTGDPIQAYAYRMNTRMNPVAERFWRELRELEIVLS